MGAEALSHDLEVFGPRGDVVGLTVLGADHVRDRLDLLDASQDDAGRSRVRAALLSVERLSPRVVDVEEHAGCGPSPPRPDAERPAAARLGPVVEDRLVIGQPGGPYRPNGAALEAPLLEPAQQIRRVKVGTVPKVAHRSDDDLL